MRYVRDVPRDDDAALDGEREHVIAHLSAVADATDDPTARAAAVQVWVIEHPTDQAQVRIVGEVDAEPDAPYLRAGYDPLAEVDPDLYAAEVAAAQLDEAVPHGQA